MDSPSERAAVRAEHALNILCIPLDHVIPDPGQPRKAFSEELLRGLAQTLAEGQEDPIRVRGAAPPYTIVHGERRWRAAKLAGLQTIMAIIEPDDGDAAARLRRQLTSNSQREALNPLEEAAAVDRLMRASGRPASEVAIWLGRSPATVSRLLALLDLPESVRERVARGEVPASCAYELTKSGDADEQASLADQVAAGTLTRDGLVVRRSGGRSVSRRKRRANRKQSSVPLCDGVVLVIENGAVTVDALVGSLGRLLAAARNAPRQSTAAAFLRALGEGRDAPC